MTLIERAEHEIKHLVLVSPETARELISEIKYLREVVEWGAHAWDCDSHFLLGHTPYKEDAVRQPCNCWKSKVEPPR